MRFFFPFLLVVLEKIYIFAPVNKYLQIGHSAENWHSFMRRLKNAIFVFLICVSAITAGAQSKLYLAGPFNYYGMNGFSDKWELTSEDEVFYQGTFSIPEDKLIFNIVDYENSDNYKIYGSSAREGNRVHVEFTETGGVYKCEMKFAGSGDWASEGWPGGEVTFSIDFAQAPPVIAVSTLINPKPGNDEVGVERVAANSEECETYNLRGVRQPRGSLTPGIYIENGKKIIKN